MTVKELKQAINNIPESCDNRVVLIDGYGGGYNPLSGFTHQHIKVAENFPTDKEDKKTKLAIVVSFD